MRGDRVEVVVDTGHGTQTFEILATRAGRRIEVTTGRGLVEVTELTRGGTPVRTGRFMASRVVALVEHPALEGDGARVEVETRRRLSAVDRRAGRRSGRGGDAAGPAPSDQLELLGTEPPATEPPDEVRAGGADSSDGADGLEDA